MRKAKKGNKIAKYYVDFDGTVSVSVKLSDSMARLTRLSGVLQPREGGAGGGYRNTQPARTFTAKALRQFIFQV